jgi:hypothetical protein
MPVSKSIPAQRYSDLPADRRPLAARQLRNDATSTTATRATRDTPTDADPSGSSRRLRNSATAMASDRIASATARPASR